MFKRVILFISILSVIIVSLTSCGKTNEQKTEEENRKNIKIGMADKIEPAAINLQFELNIPCKLFTPTGSVYMHSFVSTILGHKNSPQEPIDSITDILAKFL